MTSLVTKTKHKLHKMFFLLLAFLLITGCRSDSGDEDSFILPPPPPVTIESFSFLVSDNSTNLTLNEDVTGVIDGYSIKLIVSESVDVTNLVPSFTTSDNANRVEVSGVEQASGIDAHDFTDIVYYTVYSDDNEKSYNVQVFKVPEPDIFIMAFNTSSSNPISDQGAGWVDLKVKSAADLPASWKLVSGNDAFLNDHIESSDIASWTLEDGDIIRVHMNNYSGTADTAKSENNPSRWDFNTKSEYPINGKHGILYLEDGDGNVLDIVSYISDQNDGNKWIFEKGSNPLGRLESACEFGMWINSTIDGAVNLGDTNSNYARLKNLDKDGNSSGDWISTTESTSEKRITSFSFLAANNTVASLPIDRAAVISETDIAISVPASVSLDALIADFTQTGVSASAKVGADTVSLESGITQLNYSAPVIFTVTALDGTTVDYTVTVSTFDDDAKELSFFAFRAVDNVSIPEDVICTIDGTGIIAVLPRGVDLTELVAEFIYTGNNVTVDSAIQESKVTANDFSAPVVYTVNALNDTTVDYTVTVEEPPYGAAYISAASPNFSSYHSDGGVAWFEITINDASKLSGEWKIISGNDKYANQQMQLSDVSWTLSDGDVIRVHAQGYTGTTDAAMDENNAEKWDFISTSKYFPKPGHGIILIEDGQGNLIDIFAYVTETNKPADDWLESGGSNPLGILITAVNQEQWNGSLVSDAFVFTNSSDNYARLIDSSVNGNSASDWEEYCPQEIVLSNAAISPTNMLVGTSETILVTVDVKILGEAAFTSLNIDLSEVSDDSNVQQMVDDGTNGDAAAGDGLYSYEYTVPDTLAEGDKTITISTFESSVGVETTAAVTLSITSTLQAIEEGFAAYPETSSSYKSGSFTSSDTGIIWTYTHCSGNPSEKIEDETVLLARNKKPNATLISNTITGGATSISFDYRQAYSTNVNLEVFIVYGSEDSETETLLYNVSTAGEQDVVKNTGDIAIPDELLASIADGFSIKFYQPSGAGQVGVDNLIINR